MIAPELRHIKNNPGLDGLSKLIQNIRYSEEDPAMKMTLIVPWRTAFAADKSKCLCPLIVFVQGSGYTTPDFNNELPQFSRFAREGYIVAFICHRSYLNGFKSPTFLRDVKCAIRFLRKNYLTYGIDPERVGIFGTSSGGTTALLVGMTGDDERFKTDENREVSDSVKAVVDCFGPTDLTYTLVTGGTFRPGNQMFGTEEEADCLRREVSPLLIAEKGKKYPPFLLLHGDSDTGVTPDNTVLMYEKLKQCGADVQAVIVDGAPHEGNFWSDEVFDIADAFIGKNIL